jgi:hypothetical protein
MTSLYLFIYLFISFLLLMVYAIAISAGVVPRRIKYNKTFSKLIPVVARVIDNSMTDDKLSLAFMLWHRI